MERSHPVKVGDGSSSPLCTCPVTVTRNRLWLPSVNTEVLQSFKHGRKRVPYPSRNGFWTVRRESLGQAGVRTTECHGGHRSTCRLVRFAASHAVPSREVPWCGWSSAGYRVVSAPSWALSEGHFVMIPTP